MRTGIQLPCSQISIEIRIRGRFFFFAEYKSRYIWGEKEREIFNNFR